MSVAHETMPQQVPLSPEQVDPNLARYELDFAIARLEVNDDGTYLPPHERGGRIGDAMERYENTLAAGSETDTSTLRPILANFRTYASSGSREVHDEIETTPALQDALRMYGAVEASLGGDNTKAHTILGEIASPNLRLKLETELSAAEQATTEQAEALTISDEQSAQNLDQFLNELSQHTLSADTIKQEAASINTESVHIGVNRSLRAVKAMFAPGSNGRLMNQNEVALARSTSTGNAPSQNKVTAESMLGYAHHDNIFMPPLVYGALTSEHVSGGGVASGYGEVLVELTDEAEARATYTAGDSTDRLFAPGHTASHAKEIQLNHDDAVQGYAYYLAHKNPNWTKQLYIEAQIPGVSIGDVARVTLPSIAEGSPSQYNPAEILEVADTIAAEGKTVRIAYEMTEKLSRSSKVVGESLEAFTARMHAINPKFEVEDRRTLRQIEWSNRHGYISAADARAEEEVWSAQYQAKYGHETSSYGGIDVEA